MILVNLWLAWVAFNFALVCLVSLLPSKRICFTGFVVKVPRKYESILTAAELRAAVQHELAHKLYGHVWIAFAMRCVFKSPSARVRRMWELQADNAVDNKKALASALRKISVAPFDLYRADRLENNIP